MSFDSKTPDASSHMSDSFAISETLPLVSVIIDNYNYGRYLGKAIDSVLQQTYRNVELIVVDDGSTDESRNIIARYDKLIKPVLKENGGQSSAVNAGFSKSIGLIIFFLDSDDWFFPEKIERIVNYYISSPYAQWIFDPVVMMFPDGNTRIVPFYSGDISVDARASARRGKLGPAAPAHSGLSFTRTLLERLLPMTEDIRMGCDNYLKFASMAMAPGIQLSRAFTAQRIHDANAGTLRTDKLLQKARQHLLIARELRLNVPEASRFSERIFARAAADYIRCRERDSVCKAAILTYLKLCSLSDLLDIIPRTIYQCFRRIGSTG
jgi:glycosyltransferase involved in cell wall biosynthesis